MDYRERLKKLQELWGKMHPEAPPLTVRGGEDDPAVKRKCQTCGAYNHADWCPER